MRACLRAAYARCGARPARKDALTRESHSNNSLPPATIRLLDCATARSSSLAGPISGADGPRLCTCRFGDGFLFHLTHSETKQTGQDRADAHMLLVGRAAQALEAWTAGAQTHEGALF